MKEYIDTILKTNLFNNLKEDEIILLLKNFNAEIRDYTKSSIIIDTFYFVDSIYIILCGRVEVSKIYEDSHKNIVNILTDGDIFAEAILFSSVPKSPISVISLSDSKILKIKALTSILDSNIAYLKNIFIENLLKIISDKNKFLSLKNDILSQKSLRQKIIMYFKYLSKIQNTREVTIPYNRDKLAEFISADRSALSRELSRLDKENIIKIDGNKVILIKKN